MFGQGIGPLGLRALRAQARSILPGLSILGLREDRVGRDLALSLEVQPSALVVTGDDALEIIGNHASAVGDALGVSLRVSGYSGVDLAMAARISDLTLEMAAAFDAPIVGLPVSWHTADAEVLRSVFLRRRNRAEIVLDDIASPAALVTATATCRAVITGSYHVAVFALAQGVPAVCLTKSPYYDAKFGGLQALFPDACLVVSLDEPDFPGHMRAAVKQAWQLQATARIAAKETADRLRDAGRSAYAQFRATVEKGSTQVAADRQGGMAT
jgi:colanic acid/amylovoran biosynthesis protein